MLKYTLWGLVIITTHCQNMENIPTPTIPDHTKHPVCPCNRLLCLGILPGQSSHGRTLTRHTWPPLTAHVSPWKNNVNDTFSKPIHHDQN